MTIRAILACDEDWGIGRNGDLPWPPNSADLKWFKDNTIGDVVVMGKTTWDSLPEKSKPLPNRNNVIVTSSERREPGPFHFMEFDTALGVLPQMNLLQNVWIIGGAQLVEGMIDLIEEMWLSRIEGFYDCDTHLPKDLIKEQYSLVESKSEGGVNIEIWRKK